MNKLPYVNLIVERSMESSSRIQLGESTADKEGLVITHYIKSERMAEQQHCRRKWDRSPSKARTEIIVQYILLPHARISYHVLSQAQL